MINFSSDRALKFTESVIREMTRICLKHRGVNLAQGFPDFPAPAEIKEAALKAIQGDFNQYAITWGTPNLRQAIAEKFAWYIGVTIDPKKEVIVCCGRSGQQLLQPCFFGDDKGSVLLSQKERNPTAGCRKIEGF